jgi:hypothetical protein
VHRRSSKAQTFFLFSHVSVSLQVDFYNQLGSYYYKDESECNAQTDAQIRTVTVCRERSVYVIDGTNRNVMGDKVQKICQKYQIIARWGWGGRKRKSQDAFEVLSRDG